MQNFLCYTDTTFDFGDSGLTLISGPSGCGKTSILRAVFFALFGDGTKVQSYGKTSCSVELYMDDIKVVRTKRPNRLVVNDIYEDEAAQSIITTKFGITFKSSGYIQQNNLTSFILMSPGDKLTFLEQFAFQDVDLGKIKGRCKSHIARLHEELLGTTAQLEMSIKIFEDMVIPKKVSFPLKCKVVDREKVCKNEDVRLKNTIILIGRAEKVMEKLVDELHAREILDTLVMSKRDNYDSLQVKLSNLVYNGKYIGDDELSKMEIQLGQLCANRDLVTLEASHIENISNLDQMREAELFEYRKEHEDIKSKLWDEYSSDELESTLEDNISFLEDINTLENLRGELDGLSDITEKYVEKIRLELEKHHENLSHGEKMMEKISDQHAVYMCPGCDSGLHMIDCKLTLAKGYTDYIDMDVDVLQGKIDSDKCMIRKLQSQVQKAEHQIMTKTTIEEKISIIVGKYEEIVDSESIQDDIAYLQQYKMRQKQQENRLGVLTSNILDEKLSHTYNSYKQTTDETYKKLCIMKDRAGPSETKYTEDELRDIISSEKNHRNNERNMVRLRAEISGDMESLLQDINNAQSTHTEKYGESKTIDIESQKDIITKLLEKKVIHEKNMINIELWKKYKNEYMSYDQWKCKVSELKIKEKGDRNRYVAATTLKNKILEAESMAISNIIDTINMHARSYLDCFFSDHPISVQLQPFKETKNSTKPCINMSIEYKGMECDLSMMSGGELSRVVLAYTLALSEMFNTPLLLLDECTSSLDQELTNVVFDGIRDNFGGKLVIIIAHQVIVGTFDKIINL